VTAFEKTHKFILSVSKSEKHINEGKQVEFISDFSCEPSSDISIEINHLVKKHPCWRWHCAKRMV